MTIHRRKKDKTEKSSTLCDIAFLTFDIAQSNPASYQ